MNSGTANALPLPPSFYSRLSLRLDRFFHFSERGSSLAIEILAGLTTFSTMSYVLVVHPLVLSAAGMDRNALITATALVAAIFSILMGLRTNYPLAMAPGMGVNAYVAVQVCQGMHIPWQAALGMVFYTGVLFFIISVTGIRQKIIESFPDNFRKTIGAGIGLFIAFLGLKNSGILVANARTIIGLGDFRSPTVLLAFAGILLAIVLVVRKVPGALILSIALLTIAGLFLPAAHGPGHITPLPQHLFSLPNSIEPVAFKLDLLYPLQHPAQCIPIVIALLFTDLFAAMAVLFAIGDRAHLNDESGNLPKLKQTLSADAAAASGGSLLGSTTAIIYLESTAGVEQGGRTGLVSITVAIAFLLSLFLTPIIAIIPAVATTPALVMIGIFMMQSLAALDLREVRVTAVVLLTLLLMALTSVSDGFALGFLVEITALTAAGKIKTIKPISWLLVVLFVLHYLFK